MPPQDGGIACETNLFETAYSNCNQSLLCGTFNVAVFFVLLLLLLFLLLLLAQSMKNLLNVKVRQKSKNRC